MPFPKPLLFILHSLASRRQLFFQPVNCHGDKILAMAWILDGSFSGHLLHVRSTHSTMREKELRELVLALPKSKVTRWSHWEFQHRNVIQLAQKMAFSKCNFHLLSAIPRQGEKNSLSSKYSCFEASCPFFFT